MIRIPVFISSKQVELHEDRIAVAEIVSCCETLEPVFAEDWAPRRASPIDVYRADALRCPLYIGLFWKLYSAATEEEYRLAMSNCETEILLYVRSCPEEERDESLRRLIAEFHTRHVFLRYDSVLNLKSYVQRHLFDAVVRMVTRLHRLGRRSRSARPGASTPEQLIASWGLAGTVDEIEDALATAHHLLDVGLPDSTTRT